MNGNYRNTIRNLLLSLELFTGFAVAIAVMPPAF